MFPKKQLRTFLMGTCLFAIFLSSLVWAGTTGKIRGVVKDAETGDPLPGVNGAEGYQSGCCD